MKRWIIGAFLLSLTPSAYGHDSCPEDKKSDYQLGKDVANLQHEVQALKELIQKLGTDPEAVEKIATVESPPDTKPVDRRVRKSKPSLGTVTGKVNVPGGRGIAYVYVENVRGRMVRGRSIKIRQRNKQFRPSWAVIQKGTSIEFPNEDSIYHNVFSMDPKAKFDLGIYRAGDETKAFRFTKAGLIDIHCNIHEKMNARVLVVPNHLFAPVKKDGTFTLKGVPPGKRKIVAWSPTGAQTQVWVTVAAGKTATANISIQPWSPTRHSKKDGQPYGSYE